MSDINTPEPPSRLDDQLVPAAATFSTGTREGSQVPNPTTVESEQSKAKAIGHKAEDVIVPETNAKNGEELPTTASAVPEETNLPLSEESLEKNPETTAPTSVNIKEEQTSTDEPLSDEHISNPPLTKDSQKPASNDILYSSEESKKPTSFEDPSLVNHEKQEISTGNSVSLIGNEENTSATIEGQAGKAEESLLVNTQDDTSMLEEASTKEEEGLAQIQASVIGKETPSISASTDLAQPATTVSQGGILEQPVMPMSMEAPPVAPDVDPTLANSVDIPHDVSAKDGFASNSAENLTSGARRSMEAHEKARQEEALRLQKENEDMRLMWLSLPANDHLTYYSETEEEASGSSNEGNGIAPKGAYGGMPLLSRTNVVYGNGKRKRQDWLEDERESSDSDDENLEVQEKSDERRYRTGNRGNKLLKGSRWNRRGKLGLWTEAKNEKEMHDRFMSRVKAIQRAGVESLLLNAPGPKAIQGDGPVPRDMLEGSDRMLFKDINSTNIIEENLQSTSLAPALLRPILSARALLESHTLRHTFRNPHIGALSKTALDLRESEGHLSRALGRCFSAMEKMNAYVEDTETCEVRVNGSQNTDYEMDLKAIGAEGTAGTADEVNPALIQLDDLFVTKKGLPIPVAISEGEEQVQQSTETQAVLTTNQQRDVIRAALECLQDLGLDSLEYVERLDEVRGRLEGVKRRRTQVWESLRLWALKRDGGEEEDENEVEIEEEEILNSRSTAKQPVAVNSAAPNRRKR